MLPRYLMSLAVAGIVAAAHPVFGQEPVEETQVLLADASSAEQRGEGDTARRAVPRGSRPQGGNPTTGTAVPRAARQAPPPRGAVRGVPPRAAYRAPYAYNYRGPYVPSRRAVYGAGYLYYGPGFYGPRYYGYPGYYGFGAYYGYPGFYGYGGYGGYYGYPGFYIGAHVDSGRPYDIGEVRLQMSPRHAQVFVDGGYAGTVDDFDGSFQSLKLESGSYTIRIEATGYEPVEFDVRITPGQKITYREDLRRE